MAKILSKRSNVSGHSPGIGQLDLGEIGINTFDGKMFIKRDSDNTIIQVNTDTQLTLEQVQDYVGAMVSGNTETGITVTYDDANGKLDFVVTASPTVKNVTEEFTAAAGQTDFATTGFTGTADLQVFQNGILLSSGDYTKATPNVTLNTGAVVNDIVSIKILDLGV